MIRAAVILVFVGGVAVLSAQAPAPAPSALAFEVASVKRAESRTMGGRAPIPRGLPGGRFGADSATVDSLIWFAYGTRQDLIVGGPDWVRQDLFEISAKAESDAPAAEIKLMVQTLLKERFKLVVHKEPREMSVQALVRARPNGQLGPGIFRIDECSPPIINELRQKFPQKYPTPTAGGTMSGCSSVGLDNLALILTMSHGSPIIDATGLTESFYFTLRSQLRPLPMGVLGRPMTPDDPNLPALSTALEEQLGLKLQSRKGPVDVLVIDSVERPSPD
jgi:uncharacterized protein (TIGR03435 family)